jgi:transcriptional regulator with XRE-family HTH domain
MDNYDFVEWLQMEMTQRGLRQADLAKAAGLYPATIAKVLARERQAGPDVCNALAKALDIPPEVIFRRAGLLPETPATPMNKTCQEVCALVQQLDLGDQDDVLDYIKFRLRRATAKGK